MTFLWLGDDGDEPALTLDAIDIDVLLHLVDRYREQPADELSRWPNQDDLSRVAGWLARWKRAQTDWEEHEEDTSRAVDPLDERPF